MIRAPSFGPILVLAVILVLLFLLWLGAAQVIFLATLGPELPASLAAFASDVATTEAGWTMIVLGMAVGGAFITGYGVARTFVEFFRQPDIQIGFLAGGLTMGMLLSVPMILIGVIAMIWSSRRTSPAAEKA